MGKALDFLPKVQRKAFDVKSELTFQRPCFSTRRTLIEECWKNGFQRPLPLIFSDHLPPPSFMLSLKIISRCSQMIQVQKKLEEPSMVGHFPGDSCNFRFKRTLSVTPSKKEVLHLQEIQASLDLSLWFSGLY